VYCFSFVGKIELVENREFFMLFVGGDGVRRSTSMTTTVPGTVVFLSTPLVLLGLDVVGKFAKSLI
jgi:hypothetical protein